MSVVSSLSDLFNFGKLTLRAATGRKFGFSFNVADRCPIGCNCYWRAQQRVAELTDDEAVAFFHAMKRHGHLLVVLVGGEPYVRPRLLERLTPIIPANWVVTSGTCPLRRLTRTTHFVSIDGADAQTHDEVRRSPGLFNRILKNLAKAKEDGIRPVYVHSVLNARNYGQIRNILVCWRDNGLAEGIVFSTMTPIWDAGDHRLRLSEAQRMEIVEILHVLRDEYQDFLLNSHAMIDRLRPIVTRHQTPKTCSTARFIASIDAAGQPMRQCILSERANCSQCGCVVTSLTDTVLCFPPDQESFRTLSRLRTL